MLMVDRAQGRRAEIRLEVAIQLFVLGSLRRQFSLHAAVYICRASTLDVYLRLHTLRGAAMWAFLSKLTCLLNLMKSWRPR